jgi:hypothetical protein
MASNLEIVVYEKVGELNESVRALNDTLKKLVEVEAIRAGIELLSFSSEHANIVDKSRIVKDNIFMSKTTLSDILNKMRKE